MKCHNVTGYLNSNAAKADMPRLANHLRDKRPLPTFDKILGKREELQSDVADSPCLPMLAYDGHTDELVQIQTIPFSPMMPLQVELAGRGDSPNEINFYYHPHLPRFLV